jgi:hypothetical protein
MSEQESTTLLTIEQARELMKFLMGGAPPEGFTVGKRPRKMTSDQAFSVIYLLQERYHVIPDSFEVCSNCGWLFDDYCGGHIPENGGKYFCDNCSHLCRCKDCKRAMAR